VPLTFTPLQNGSVILIAWVYCNHEGIKQVDPLQKACLFLQTEVGKNKLMINWYLWNMSLN